ncbi:hypothetical protein V3C99_006526 [Haemonchus contortus]
MVSCRCSVCDCGPMRLSYLYEHLRRAHNWTDEQIREEEVAIKAKRYSQKGNLKCDACDRTFLSDQSWRHHWKRAHVGVERIAGFYVVCPSCQQKFPDATILVRHWREEHEQEIDQSVDPNFFLASLTRTLREIDSLERRKRPPPSCNPGWRWRGRKKTPKEPPVQEISDGKDEPSTAGDTLFQKVVKQEEPGPSHDPDQGTSEMNLTDEGQDGDLSESSVKKTDQLQKAVGLRRTRANETPEEREERRRFKAERARIRRYQNRLRQEKEREVVEHPVKVVEIRPQSAEGNSRQYPATAADILPIVSAQISPRGLISSMGRKKTTCYAIVGIESEEERRRFSELVMSNGFRDLKFISGPFDEPRNGTPTTKIDQLPLKNIAPRASSQSQKDPPRNLQKKFASKMEISNQPRVPPVTSGDSGSVLSYLIAKEEALSEDQSEQPTYQDDQGSSCSSRSSEIGEVYPITRQRKAAMDKLKSSCLVCGLQGQPEEIRMSSCKGQENAVLFACLCAQTIVEIKEARKMYEKAQNSSVPICHDHYIQAAEFIGKAVEMICGRFPDSGFADIPSNVKDDLLSLVEDYANRIGGTALMFDDVSSFLNECLMKYYNKSSWSPQGTNSKLSGKQGNLRIQKIPSTTKGQSPKSSKCPARECPVEEPTSYSASSSHEKPTNEVGEGDSREMTAIDLLGTLDPTRSPSPIHSVVVISSPSTDSKDSISATYSTSPGTSKSPGKDQDAMRCSDKKDIIAVPFGMELRDQSTLIDTLNDDDFWNHFRITRKTFTALCSVLEKILNSKGDQRTSSPTAIKLGTTLEILAGNTLPSTCFTAGDVTRIFADVIPALAEWSTTMVQWPDDWEREKINENFFEMTGLKNIVGCIDGTLVKGTQSLNVGLVADDRKRFRWVFAKFHSKEDDDSVFKQSSLCQQLRDGRRKGILIGDDAYKRESFLLTPNRGKDWMTEEDFAMANTVRNAHLTVQEAITNWKRQFPILNGTIRFPRVARVVVCCAALYNLSRSEGEPLFEAENQTIHPADEAVEQCLTVSE